MYKNCLALVILLSVAFIPARAQIQTSPDGSLTVGPGTNTFPANTPINFPLMLMSKDLSKTNIVGITSCSGAGLNFLGSSPQFASLSTTTPATINAMFAGAPAGMYSPKCSLIYGINGNPNDLFWDTAPFTLLVGDTGGTPPPTVLSTNNVMSTGDPVALDTGEIHDPVAVVSDLYLGGPRPLYFARYYAAYQLVNGDTSAAGNNWMHNFDFSVSTSAGKATVTVPGGRKVIFTQQGAAWVLSSVEPLAHQLNAVTGGGFQFADLSTELIYTFGADGKLTRIEDRNGNALTVTQSATGNGPATVADGLGRTLTFTYTGTRLASVQDQSGRQVSFRYTNGDLTGYTDARGNSWSYTYTAGGAITSLLVTTTNPAGNQPASQAFDTSGRVSKQTDGAANATTIAYSGAGPTNTATVTDPLTRISSSTHNGFNDLSAITDPAGAAESYSYDANHRMTGVTDKLGQKATFTYDAPSGYYSAVKDFAGRQSSVTYQEQDQGGFKFFVPIAITGPDGAKVQMTADSHGNLTKFTDRLGASWLYTYNSRGQILTVTNPAGAQATYTYNDDGTGAKATGFDGVAVTYGVDAVKRLSSITNSDGSATQYQRDAMNNMVREADERSKAVSLTFDANDRLSAVADPLSAQRQFAYDSTNRLTQVTDRLGNKHAYQYDAAGQVAQFRNAAGETVTFTYDLNSNMTGASDALGSIVQYIYDKDGRQIGTRDGLGKTRSVTLDADGRPVTGTTPGGQTLTLTYTPNSKLATMTDELGRVTKYTYDARDSVTGVNQAGLAATFEYDALNDVTAIVDPNGARWLRQFDSAGRRISQTDPAGNTTGFSYDSRGRIGQITTPVGKIANQYDAASRLVSQTLDDGTVLSFTYDDDGRALTANGAALQYDAEGNIINSNGLIVTRDAVGRIASITFAPGKQVKYAYDARGRAFKVTDWVGGDTVLTYDLANRVTSIQRPNGTTTQFTYDANDRVTAIADAKGSTAISSVQLTRDAAGQTTAAVRNVPIDAQPSAGVAAYSYDAADQLVGAAYDGAGRLTNAGSQQYKWNQAGRLTSYTRPDGAAQFTYDGYGNRTSRASGSTVQNYVWNYALALPSVSVERSATADVRYYIHLPNGILLQSVEAADNTRRFYHFDDAGSTVALTDDSGAVTDSYASSPYGEDVRHNGTSPQPFTYQGAYGVMQEGSSVLYYMRARYYDAASARFISRDPVVVYDPMIFNPYQYAAANPLTYGDPTGLTTTWIQPGSPCTGFFSNGSPCPPNGSTATFSPFVSGGGFLVLYSNYRIGEYLTFANGLDSHFGALTAGMTTMEQVERTNRLYALFGNAAERLDRLKAPSVKPINWLTENTAELATLEKNATKFKFVKGLGYVAIAADVGFTIYDGVKHGDGTGTIILDSGATAIGDVGVMALGPVGAAADVVTLGGVSGSITNGIIAPVEACKIAFSDRYTSADAARFGQRMTRKPLLKVVWWLGTKLANVIVPD